MHNIPFLFLLYWGTLRAYDKKSPCTSKEQFPSMQACFPTQTFLIFSGNSDNQQNVNGLWHFIFIIYGGRIIFTTAGLQMYKTSLLIQIFGKNFEDPQKMEVGCLGKSGGVISCSFFPSSSKPTMNSWQAIFSITKPLNTVCLQKRREKKADSNMLQEMGEW